ncbi:hypothetical protein RND81_04G123800 [Saponaria officinalis]|uniref:histone acetyltransferase n=1 Tax=Saponaria officinalis TaxID=3572 RepID=A0AAW1LLA9_SAPOF
MIEQIKHWGFDKYNSSIGVDSSPVNLNDQVKCLMTMQEKAREEKIVVKFSNLYDKLFMPNGDNNTKVIAARLPYFEGDYRSAVAENMIKKIAHEVEETLDNKLIDIEVKSLCL